MKELKSLLACLLMISAINTQAQSSSSLFGGEEGKQEGLKVEAFGWSDTRHIEKQVERIDGLTRKHFGQPVRGDKSDIALLQRIVYQGLIDKSDTMSLQALGAVLGNVFAQHNELNWRTYEDKYGKSRAVCVRDTQECLFVVTMLSRRMEVGILVNVQDVYDNAMEMVSPLLTKAPYSVQ